MSSIDASNTTNQNNTISELAGSKKKGKGKKKGMEDNVQESGVAGVGDDDYAPTKKRRRVKGKDKNKGKDDDVVDGTMGAPPTKSKKRKKKDD